MRQERLEYLQKKYESRLNTVKDSDMMANVSGEPKRPKGPAMGPGRHGKQRSGGAVSYRPVSGRYSGSAGHYRSAITDFGGLDHEI